MWFAGFATARATQGPTPGGREKFISYSNWEWNLSLKSFWHNLTKYSNLACSEKIPHQENLRSTRPVYMGSDNMIQLRSVLQFKIMNMVQSILNSSLVKFLIFYQLQNTVVYPLILPSRITPSEIQKIVINRALLCQLCVQYFIEFHVNFASHEFHRKCLHAKKTIQSTCIDAKFTQINVWVLFFFNIHMKNVMNFLWGAIALVIIYNL